MNFVTFCMHASDSGRESRHRRASSSARSQSGVGGAGQDTFLWVPSAGRGRSSASRRRNDSSPYSPSPSSGSRSSLRSHEGRPAVGGLAVGDGDGLPHLDAAPLASLESAADVVQSPRQESDAVAAASRPGLSSKRETNYRVAAATKEERSALSPISVVDNMPDVEGDWSHSDGGCSTKAKLVSVGSVFVVILALLVAILTSSIHTVAEGHVGIYFKHGALMDGISLPGVHTMAPFVTEMRQVSIRPTTDTVNPIDAITKDGIANRFTEVQVGMGKKGGKKGREKSSLSFL